jgi:hypothetical protein
MKRISVLTLILIGFLVAIGQAQLTRVKKSPQQPIYDRFGAKWLDPAKWQLASPVCDSALECVREIENGKLRMAVRNFGRTDSDSGSQAAFPILYFQNPNAVTSITADITVRSYSGSACVTNDGTANGQAQIGGTFFNAGTGDPSDDVFAILYTYVDTSNPTIMSVNVWWGWKDQANNQPFAEYPIGTPLTATFKWDKSDHRFIGTVKIKGQPGAATEVLVPYWMSDTTPAAYPDKRLVAVTFSPNCTSGQTSAQVEATFDNVIINR